MENYTLTSPTEDQVAWMYHFHIPDEGNLVHQIIVRHTRNQPGREARLLSKVHENRLITGANAFGNYKLLIHNGFHKVPQTEFGMITDDVVNGIPRYFLVIGLRGRTQSWAMSIIRSNNIASSNMTELLRTERRNFAGYDGDIVLRQLGISGPRG